MARSLIHPRRVPSIAGASLSQVPVRAITRGLQEAVATLPGWSTEDNGLLHVRGTDDGFLYVIDGVPVYERLDQLSGLGPDLGTVASINVITGYIPRGVWLQGRRRDRCAIEVGGRATGRASRNWLAARTTTPAAPCRPAVR